MLCGGDTDTSIVARIPPPPRMALGRGVIGELGPFDVDPQGRVPEHIFTFPNHPKHAQLRFDPIKRPILYDLCSLVDHDFLDRCLVND